VGPFSLMCYFTQRDAVILKLKMEHFGVKYITAARQRLDKLQVQEDLLVGALILRVVGPLALMPVGAQNLRAVEGE